MTPHFRVIDESAALDHGHGSIYLVDFAWREKIIKCSAGRPMAKIRELGGQGSVGQIEQQAIKEISS